MPIPIVMESNGCRTLACSLIHGLKSSILSLPIKQANVQLSILYMVHVIGRFSKVFVSDAIILTIVSLYPNRDAIV